MIRRDALLRIALLSVWPKFAAAQAKRLPRVALVFNDTPLAEMTGPGPASPYVRAFVHAMRDRGYVEGRDIMIERRSAEGRPERMASLMQEVVASKVDVIVTVGRGARAATRATTSIPIVALTDDLVSVGLIESLSHPGRNLTGVGTAGAELEGKRLELLQEVLPTLKRVAVIDHQYIDSTSTPGSHTRRLAIEASARALGVDAAFVSVDTAQDVEPAFAAIVAGGAQAVLVGATSVSQINKARIIGLADRQRLPAIAEEREFAEAGGLMSYGTTTVASWTLAAQYVDRILKGVRPSELPYQQPTQYELAINMKSARRLGLTIPRSVLLRAELIE